MKVSHRLASSIIAATMVLHNYITVRRQGSDHDDFCDGRDAGWDQHFEQCAAMQCPSCRRSFALHCPHIEKNSKVRPVKPSTRGEDMRSSIRDRLWEAVTNDTQQNYVQREIEDSRRRREHVRAQRQDDEEHPPLPAEVPDIDLSDHEGEESECLYSVEDVADCTRSSAAI